MNLRENEFWRLTLKQFDSLVKRFSCKIEREDLRTAKVCASIYNAGHVQRKGNNKKPWTADDFLPRKERGRKWEDQLKVVEMLNASFGGLDKRKN